jgi:hypothetical protein
MPCSKQARYGTKPIESMLIERSRSERSVSHKGQLSADMPVVSGPCSTPSSRVAGQAVALDGSDQIYQIARQRREPMGDPSAPKLRW